jgi:hypothetical protein
MIISKPTEGKRITSNILGIVDFILSNLISALGLIFIKNHTNSPTTATIAGYKNYVFKGFFISVTVTSVISEVINNEKLVTSVPKRSDQSVHRPKPESLAWEETPPQTLGFNHREPRIEKW